MICIQSTKHAFAAVQEDGSVIASGSDDSGGDALAVKKQLVDVERIQSNDKAFAAMRRDPTVVTWGHPHYGGDMMAVWLVGVTR